MLDWLTIVILLAIGIILIVVELIFIPGMTIFGILGLILTIIGVIVSFVGFGSPTGFAVLGLTLLLTGITLYFSLRTGAWEKVSLKNASNSRVNEESKHNLWKGDTGITLSTLRPTGKAEFNDLVVEVSTLGPYIEVGTKVRVIDVQPNKILVEKIDIRN